MDLVADMLFAELTSQFSAAVRAELLRPAMRRRIPGSGRLARNGDRLMNRFYDYPRWLRKKRASFDVFHIVDHSYAHLALELAPERTVITCHDLDTFLCLLDPDCKSGWYGFFVRRILEGFRRARHVVCVSEATRQALLLQKLIPPERTSVIPNGVAPCFHAAPEGTSDAFTLLHVGSTIPRKRIDVLLRVLAAVRQRIPETRLVRAGGQFTAEQMLLAASLGVERSITVLPFLEREALADVYRRATLLLFCSEREGFGLPLVEAMSCGCPVVASDIAVLRETCGDAAEYCPVADIGAWTHTVVRLLEEHRGAPEQWRTRGERARNQATKFSWAEAARRLVPIYRELIPYSETAVDV
jgi:glycosyltransferase involved in cell wall biosynthesis